MVSNGAETLSWGQRNPPEVSHKLGTGGLVSWTPESEEKGLRSLTPRLTEKDTGGQDSRVLGKQSPGFLGLREARLQGP